MGTTVGFYNRVRFKVCFEVSFQVAFEGSSIALRGFRAWGSES